MAKIVRAGEVKKYYQCKSIASDYIYRRFREPLNQLEHQRQVEIISALIKEFRCRSVVEFAPGPARITASLGLNGWKGNGVSIDASKEMLAHARKRMPNPSWKFIHGDLLKDDLHSITRNVDLVFAIRFMLHFQDEERKRLYAQASSLLKPQGYFVFEVMNQKVVLPLRKMMGEEKYIVYDKLYAREEFRQEVERNGFRLVRLYPILNHFWLQAIASRPLKVLKAHHLATRTIGAMEQFLSQQPYEWIAVCQKK